MTNKNTIIVGAIAVLALLVGALGLLTRPASAPSLFGAIPALNAPAANTTLPNGQLLPNPSNFDYLVARLYFYVDGALGFGNGTSVPTNYQAKRVALTSATSTPCAIQNPFTSTSSVVFVAYNITTATSSAMTYAIGTSTTQYATTTSMTNLSVSAGAQATLTWEGGVNNTVIPGSGWVVVGANTGSPSSSFTTGIITAGSCTVMFHTDN